MRPLKAHHRRRIQLDLVDVHPAAPGDETERPDAEIAPPVAVEHIHHRQRLQQAAGGPAAPSWSRPRQADHRIRSSSPSCVLVEPRISQLAADRSLDERPRLRRQDRRQGSCSNFTLPLHLRPHATVDLAAARSPGPRRCRNSPFSIASPSGVTRSTNSSISSRRSQFWLNRPPRN